MTFFHEAKADGTIDDKITHKELEMAMLGMLVDSSVWQRHQEKHRDAKPVKIEPEEESRFEKKTGIKEDPQFFNYDSLTKHFTAGCQCGQRFDIDIKNDSVSELDTGLKLKDIGGYDRKSGYDGDAGPEPSSYSQGPVRQSVGYNNSKRGMNYNN